MKKFIVGLICGIALTASTAYASETIKAYLFPATFEVNGQVKQLDSEYSVLNYNGHAYVPVRFVAESLGAGVRYIDRDKVISIMNEPTNVDETMKKVWQVQYRLSVGRDHDYVRSFLGGSSAERTNDDNQQAVSRYDISPVTGYQYDSLVIDLKGLEQGEIGAQLLINWSKTGNVDKMELWYNDTKSGKIMTYYAFPDGSTSGAIYE